MKRKIFFFDVSVLPVRFFCDKNMDGEGIVEQMKNTPYFASIESTHTLSSRAAALRDDAEKLILGSVCLNLPEDRKTRLLGYGSDPEMEAVFQFDHEVGHLLSPNNEMAEYVADAYAVIRHFQRFPNSTAIDKLADMRAAGLFFGDAAHFTSPMVAEIVADKGKFDTLSLRETAKLAYNFARESFSSEFIYGLAFKITLSGNIYSLLTFTTMFPERLTTEEFGWIEKGMRALIRGDFVLDGKQWIMPAETAKTVKRKLDRIAEKLSQPPTATSVRPAQKRLRH
jgi:hypothetical protein